MRAILLCPKGKFSFVLHSCFPPITTSPTVSSHSFLVILKCMLILTTFHCFSHYHTRLRDLHFAADTAIAFSLPCILCLFGVITDINAFHTYFTAAISPSLLPSKVLLALLCLQRPSSGYTQGTLPTFTQVSSPTPSPQPLPYCMI